MELQGGVAQIWIQVFVILEICMVWSKSQDAGGGGSWSWMRQVEEGTAQGSRWEEARGSKKRS